MRFHAEADAIRYEEGKGLLTLEGTSTRAVLWRRHGGKEEKSVGIRMLYSVKRDEVFTEGPSVIGP